MNTILLVTIAGFAVCQVSTIATTVYLHRTLAHRAITLDPRASFAFRFVLWTTTGIRPREWVAVHRKHHAHSDVEGDPHSPVLEGFAMVQFANVSLYRKALKDPQLVRRYARDLQPDKWDRLLFDHPGMGLAIGIGALVVLLGPWAGLAAAGFHTVTYLVLNAAINAIGHAFGKQPHDNTSYNNQWLALITAGEGLHNNHHHASTSPKFALAPGEIDPGWWVVSLLKRTGLATLRERRSEQIAA